MIFVKGNRMKLLQQRLATELKSMSFQKACELVARTLHRSVPHYNWVGIYLVQGQELILTAWDGPEATGHVRIPIGQGICGLAARERRTVIVDDVNKDPRYLACFPYTRSEIVVPIVKAGRVLGEIDIDSDTLSAFSAVDETFLAEVAELLAERHA
ncbi:MAG: diguanylate cyclase [Candidatus Fraserbacteria bacterium RBG_16_55_9]|uniref:Diguanylate cyclase n=1 Tax=Fraserbacteria sp. (strain RBG_16_55_9) TaxID=1817864 RepID=A0A1F5V0H6_FRAXR|nr:MAG: diguanylate cyclase [Candidatus Fraserbacteria bacterium RBG_16_55_9]